jgi:voltage-gated potassium channel
MVSLALAMLVVAIVGGSLAYRQVEGWPLFDSFYMVVVTLSTVGYREVHPLSESGKLITVGLIGFGLASLTLLGASVTRLILEGELRNVLGKHKMERDITKLRDHYIICGYGRVGRVVCQELAKASAPFVVVDSSEAMEERIEADGYLVWRGNATEEDTLRAAGLERAKGIILALPSEADNVYVTLLAKDLCPSVFILARSISDHGDRRLKAAGADRVVSPNLIGGYRMAHSILHPSVVEFIDIVSGHAEMEELEVQELVVPENSSLAGVSIGESDIRRRFELLVVGRVRSDGAVAFNPAPTDTIEAGSMLIVLGRRADLDRFAEAIST